MIVNVNDRGEVERFMRFANLHELSAERERLNRLVEASNHSESATQLKAIAGRIQYAMRFRRAT